jgi:hypothetical protein
MTEVPDEALAPDEPDERPDPEEYEAEGDDTAVSSATGTVYEGVPGEAEPAGTPHDSEPPDDRE